MEGPLTIPGGEPDQIIPGSDVYGRDTLVGVLVGRASGGSCATDHYTSVYTDVRDPMIYSWLTVKVKEVQNPGNSVFY